MNPIKSAILGMALLAVADVYAGEQYCRQGGNLDRNDNGATQRQNV